MRLSDLIACQQIHRRRFEPLDTMAGEADEPGVYAATDVPAPPMR